MSAALRLALIRQRYSDSGGAERFLARALDALRDRGLALTVIARSWNAAPGVTLRRCDPFYIGALWRDLAFARCACRAAHGFDLVQSHERIACCDVYRAGDGVHREWLANRTRALGTFGRLRIKLNPYHWHVKRAERRVFESPRLRAVICNSHMVRAEILRHFRISEDKLHVVYNGVDTKAFHPVCREHREAMRARLGIAESTPVFLFVGSGFERKGIDIALRALAAIETPAHLIVVGRDKHERRYAAQATRLGLGARVHWCGAQPDVRPYYGAADAFVLPTLYDPFPNAVLEAMACALPVITSRSCGTAELIRDGENGFVVDALDTDALAYAMVILTKRDCAEMGLRARASVEPLKLDAMSEQLLALYRSLSGNITA